MLELCCCVEQTVAWWVSNIISVLSNTAVTLTTVASLVVKRQNRSQEVKILHNSFTILVKLSLQQ